jgi:large subunit ribosomal protein L15
MCNMPTHRSKKDVSVVNVKDLQLWIDMGRLPVPEDGGPITMRDLLRSGVVSRIKGGGLKLLGEERGAPLTQPLDLEVARASKGAIAAVEAAGGSVTCVYHNPLALRAHIKPELYPLVKPRHAKPPPRLMPYYLDYGNRGYLAPEIQLRKQLQKLGLGEGDLEK